MVGWPAAPSGPRPFNSPYDHYNLQSKGWHGKNVHRLFDGTFRYFDRGKRKIPVWGKLHVSGERYDATHELVPLSVTRGTRTYVMLHLYVLWPKLVMTVGLYKKPRQLADTDPVIGKSLGTRQEGVQEIRIGSGQAWYYRRPAAGAVGVLPGLICP